MRATEYKNDDEQVYIFENDEYRGLAIRADGVIVEWDNSKEEFIIPYFEGKSDQVYASSNPEILKDILNADETELYNSLEDMLNLNILGQTLNLVERTIDGEKFYKTKDKDEFIFRDIYFKINDKGEAEFNFPTDDFGCIKNIEEAFPKEIFEHKALMAIEEDEDLRTKIQAILLAHGFKPS